MRQESTQTSLKKWAHLFLAMLSINLIFSMFMHSQISLGKESNRSNIFNANGEPDNSFYLNVILPSQKVSHVSDFSFITANEKDTTAALSYEERISCQRTIEKVYWQYRIWPKDNPQPKQAFEQIMSEEAIRTKVNDTLKKTNALEFYWHKPVTGEQLQAELNRMAASTKKPQMLKDLWNALNNDPHLIAECLVRPILVDELTRNLFGSDSKYAAWWQKAKIQFAVNSNEPTYSYSLPKIQFDTCTFDTWTPTTTVNAPAARQLHTAVWTGAEMIIWGSGGYLNTGSRYYPATDSWIATTTDNAPAGRCYHAAVWTGTEMIIWGGSNGTPLKTGGRYNPGTDSWTETQTVLAPAVRQWFAAVWTGTEMIVWGGQPSTNTGGRYNPGTNSWTATSTINAPIARYNHTAVWTGTEMIIWGGYGPPYLNTGGRYNPATNSWNTTSTTGAPDGRWNHTSVWTGSEMIIWGGHYLSGYDDIFLNTGGRYNPNNDSWTATNTINAPAIRAYHTGVWTDTEMIVWGGIYDDGTTIHYLNTGSRYNPVSDSWTATGCCSPAARYEHTAVWTETEMIIWGGQGSSSALNTGGKYCAFMEGAPGAVPDNDNYAGTPLTIAKSSSNLVLNWSAPGANCVTQDYSIYRGTLPWTGYNHSPYACSTGGLTSITIIDDPDSYYYLIVAQNNSKEGSYGFNSANFQIPAAAIPCFPQLIGNCQ